MALEERGHCNMVIIDFDTDSHQIPAFSVIGDLMKVLGSVPGFMSFMGEITTVADVSPTAAHANAEAGKPTLNAAKMFATISTHFNKLALSRKLRIGLFDFYAALLTKLGSAFVEVQ
ncbi:hypothetical protein B0H11DRAFT_2253479 [Mycena galericulata]|nr:hypothetical protein B0H11DRAFT_2253479 [Mycena galericulata]